LENEHLEKMNDLKEQQKQEMKQVGKKEKLILMIYILKLCVFFIEDLI